jgi:hypothetical protein
MRIESTPARTHDIAPRNTRTEATPAPAPAPATTTTEALETAPVTTSRGRGAEHRSDVATLRQWVNHPERRDSIALPDLTTAAPHGQGFAKAVAAYQAVLAELAPQVTEGPPVDPAPVDPAPLDPTPLDPTAGPVVDEPVADGTTGA